MSDNDSDSDHDRVRSYLEGNAYLKARAQVARLVRSHRIPPSVVDDIVQEVLAAACEYLMKPECQPIRSFPSLLTTLTHRACISWTRKERRRRTVPLDTEHPDRTPHPDIRIGTNERKRLATEVMKKLSHTARELIEKVIMEGRTYAEIAATTGRSEGALRVEMCNSLKKARTMALSLQRRRLWSLGKRNGDR